MGGLGTGPRSPVRGGAPGFGGLVARRRSPIGSRGRGSQSGAELSGWEVWGWGCGARRGAWAGQSSLRGGWAGGGWKAGGGA